MYCYRAPNAGELIRFDFLHTLGKLMTEQVAQKLGLWPGPVFIPMVLAAPGDRLVARNANPLRGFTRFNINAICVTFDETSTPKSIAEATAHECFHRFLGRHCDQDELMCLGFAANVVRRLGFAS